ncbi:valine--tRNA ligase-like [Chrysoperla carnea]|uniref:valine--tRNA ligase-like n=1 Tax=Chrysoperla carnea TaxID=189513 RepID=UPI001D069622|nr:valine--tRNA ligase-like [Chrysoperla carnea]
MKILIKVHLLQVTRKHQIFNKLKRTYSTFTWKKNTPSCQDKLATAYVPKDVEKNKYKNWEKNNYFTPKSNSKEKFSIILPPPNVTGTLHLGHALTIAIEDSIVRWHRMRNHSTLWIPGLDHAGIATQVIVEKKLLNETKQSRHDIGRGKFVEKVWKWTHKKATTIEHQLRQLGASLNWDRMVFTMDPHQTDAVTEAFIQLFNKGLIYRSKSLVNWSCTLQSAISDIELDQLDIVGPTNIYVPGYKKHIQFGVLHKFAYKIHNSDEELVVSTTRPETMIGDVAVAVHPDDDRYSHLRGKYVWHPFRKEPIPIIFDNFVDRGFGTGAVKITPGHDRIDYEVAKRHSLPSLEIIDEKGLIKNVNESTLLNGVKRFDARKIIIDNLHEMSLARGQEDHKMILPICSRSNDVIEYLLKPQWFVDCKNMAQNAIEAVQTGKLIIEPKVFERNWFDWLTNIRDWNISRQLWWGHRIPAFHCSEIDSTEDKSVWIAAKNENSAMMKAVKILGTNNIRIVQDEDVLDTWFSSGLMPFSVFGWPKQTSDLKEYYPLSMIETGHDILFFWVARMVMLGTELTGQLPFTKILLHGIICDADGRKMSKSLGNVISPDDIIHGISLKELNGQVRKNYQSGLLSEAEFKKATDGQAKMFPNGIPAGGADALRFTLCSHNIKSHFINFNVAECNTNRLFCNKIWQATKYTRNAIDCIQQYYKNIPSPLVEKILTKQTRTRVAADYNSEPIIEIYDKYTSTVYGSQSISLMDRWIMSRLTYLVEIVNKALEDAELHVATGALKTFFYTEFCDIYLECTKPGLKILKEQEIAKESLNIEEEKENNDKILIAYGHCVTLSTCLEVGLRCLAPFMPYMSEHLYPQILLDATSPLVTNINDANFPVFKQYKQWRNIELEKDVNTLMELVIAIRRMKSINIEIMTTPTPPETSMNKKQNQEKYLVYIETLNPLYKQYLNIIETLVGLKCEIVDSISSINNNQSHIDNNIRIISDTVGSNCTIYSFTTNKEETNDLTSKKEIKLKKELEKLLMVTTQEGYILKASQNVKDAHREKINKLTEELKKIQILKKQSM